MNFKEYLGSKKFERLKQELGLENDLAVPRIVKIVINMGIGENGLDKKKVKSLSEQMALITGQWPRIRRAKQAVSAFDVKENQIVGLQVTLRKGRMYDFFKKLVSIILPSWRDFKGIPSQSLTRQGDITIGLKADVVFPEVDYDRVEVTNGMSISITTTAKNAKEGRKLFEALGLIFETEQARRMREEAAALKKEERMAQAAKKRAYQELAKIKIKEKEKAMPEEK